jgi:hypothetical protein
VRCRHVNANRLVISNKQEHKPMVVTLSRLWSQRPCGVNDDSDMGDGTVVFHNDGDQLLQM